MVEEWLRAEWLRAPINVCFRVSSVPNVVVFEARDIYTYIILYQLKYHIFVFHFV